MPGMTTSLRSMGARSPPVLGSQLQMLSLNKSDLKSHELRNRSRTNRQYNSRTNRQEYNKVRQKIEDLFLTHETQPKITV